MRWSRKSCQRFVPGAGLCAHSGDAADKQDPLHQRDNRHHL